MQEGGGSVTGPSTGLRCGQPCARTAWLSGLLAPSSCAGSVRLRDRLPSCREWTRWSFNVGRSVTRAAPHSRGHPRDREGHRAGRGRLCPCAGQRAQTADAVLAVALARAGFLVLPGHCAFMVVAADRMCMSFKCQISCPLNAMVCRGRVSGGDEVSRVEPSGMRLVPL